MQSTYRDFVHGLKLAGIDLDRKQLAELAIYAAFGRLVTMASDAPRPPIRPAPDDSRRRAGAWHS